VSDPPRHLRPFFSAAEDFRAATAPHFKFLVDEFGFEVAAFDVQAGVAFDLRYDGSDASVLLSWDVEGGYFGCHLVPRLPHGGPDPDSDHWLSPNEVLAVRGARDQLVTHDQLEGVDESGYAQVMERVAGSLRQYCADVLRGDWTIYERAHRWFEEQAGL
jgi:hypothetical protein